MISLRVITAWDVYRAPAAAIGSTVPSITPVGISLLESIAVLETWAPPVWLAGVLAFALRLIWSSRHIARLRREGEPPDASLIETVSRLARRMNISRPIQILVSRLADSPSIAGWLRPMILLPAATLLNLSPGAVRDRAGS